MGHGHAATRRLIISPLRALRYARATLLAARHDIATPFSVPFRRLLIFMPSHTLLVTTGFC